MGKLTRVGFFALLAAAICSPAFAQRGAISGGGMRVSSPGVRTVPVQRVSGIQRSNISFNGVPGLGFDFAHVAALSRARGVGTHRFRFASGLTPFSPFGFSSFIGLPVVVIQQPVMVAPEAVEEDSPAPPIAAPPQAQLRAAPQTQGPPRDNLDAPLPPPTQDTGEYVFIKRDGTIVFAVAFTSDSSQLTYITREGVRRTLLLSQLDADTTRQMNAERGTSIQLPL